MMDIQKFKKRIDEFCDRKGISQKALAGALYISESALSLILSGKRRITSNVVKSCILYLVEQEAITGREQVEELLELADCKDFSPADWASFPLNNLPPPLVSPAPQPRQVNNHPNVLADTLKDDSTLRISYLERVIRRYNQLTLPIGMMKPFVLQSVFQPLALRQEKFLAEILTHEERRAFLDEATRSEFDPRFASSQEEELAKQGEGTFSFHLASDGYDALTQSPQQRMILLGEPGMGKTALLKNFIVETAQKALAKQTALLPLYISLPHLAEMGQSFQQYLTLVVGELGIDSSYAMVLWNAIGNGKAFICLDNLEQVAPERRREIIAWINDQAAAPGNVWIISSRYNEYNGEQFSTSFVEWELCPMTHPLRERLARELSSQLSQQVQPKGAKLAFDSVDFVQKLEHDNHAVGWGKNPLLFSLTAVFYARRGELPRSRAALYKETVAGMIGLREQNRNKQVLLRHVIASLALRSYEKRDRYFSRESLLEELAHVRKSLDEIWRTEEIAQATFDSGILEIVAKDTYGFWHQTFQEYFAATDLARKLVRRDSQTVAWSQAWQKRTYSRWTEVLRLMVGVLIHEYAEQGGITLALSWLQALLDLHKHPQGDVGDLGLALAIQSFNEVGDSENIWKNPAWMSMEETIVHRWMEAILETVYREQNVRQKRLLRLVQDLARLHSSTVELIIQYVEELITSSEAEMRIMAIHILGKLGRSSPTQLLIGVLGDQHNAVSEAAIKALVELGEFTPVDALVESCRSNNPVVRRMAIQTLGEVKRPSLVNELLSRLYDTDPFVRHASVSALGKLGEKVPVQPLIRLLHDPEEFVRVAVIEALGKVDNALPVSLFIEALDDPSDAVHAAAIYVLGEKTPPEKLVEAINSQAIPMIVRESLHAAKHVLGQMEEQKVLQIFFSGGMPDDQDTRALAREIVASQQDSSMDEALNALRGNHAEYRENAIHILCHKQKWALLENFVTSQETLRCITHAVALRMVGRLGEPVLVTHALVGIHDDDPKIRLAALQALADLNDKVPAEAVNVALLLKDDDYLIRIKVLHILTHAAKHVPVTQTLMEDILLITVEDESLEARKAAKKCLKKLRHFMTDTLTVSLICHQKVSIRLATLKVFGMSLSLKILRQAAHDEDEAVRYEAKFVLRRRKSNNGIKRPNRMPEQGSRMPIGLNMEAIVEAQLLKKLCGDTIFRSVPSIKYVRIEDGAEWEPEIWPELDHQMNGKMLMLVDTTQPQDPVTQARVDWENEVHERIVQLLRRHAPIEGLMAALNDENRDIRVVALEALKERTPREKLEEALYDEDCLVRKEALLILDTNAPLYLVLRALGDEHEVVSDIALDILKRIAHDLPKEQLMTLLESQNAVVRANAIQALEGKAPVEALLAALGDSSEEVRLAALDTLLLIGPTIRSMIVSEITNVLLQKNASTHLESAAHCFILDIVRQMERFSPALKENLTKLLSWPYWEVQVKAAQSLAMLRQNVPAKALDQLQNLRNNSSSQVVREAADDALSELLSLERGFEDDEFPMFHMEEQSR